MSLLSKLFGRSEQGAAGRLLDRERFTETYLTMLARDAPEIMAEKAGTNVRLTWPDGGTMTQFLDNAYAQYQASPDDIEGVLRAQLASARASAQPQPTLDLGRVLPVIKTRAWLATASTQAAAADMVVQPLVADLIVVFAQDLPDTIAYVRGPDLAGICDESELHRRAIANLMQRVSALQSVGADGRYRVALDGFFDASLILVASAWIGPLALGGDPVFAIPCRDQLMVCGSTNREAVAELAEIAPQIAASEAYDITGELLTIRDGRLQTLA